jgi:hypothetical protein
MAKKESRDRGLNEALRKVLAQNLRGVLQSLTISDLQVYIQVSLQLIPGTVLILTSLL